MMETVVNSEDPILANRYVSCYSDHLVVHLYYFPCGDKKVNYRDIILCELHDTNDIHIMQHKLWGMSFSPIWWHCDMKRFGRKHYILINASQWPLIGLTMNDDDIMTVYNFIRQKMNENDKTMFPNPVLTGEKSQAMLEKEAEHQRSLQATFNKE